MEGPVKSIHSVRHEGKFFPHFHQSHSTQMVCRVPSCNCFGYQLPKQKASATSAHSLYCKNCPLLSLVEFQIQIAFIFRGHSNTKHCNLWRLHPQNHHKRLSLIPPKRVPSSACFCSSIQKKKTRSNPARPFPSQPPRGWKFSVCTRCSWALASK